MDDTEYQQMQDDLDVEIVDLHGIDNGDDSESKRNSAVKTSRASLHTSLPATFLPRRHILQLGITTSIVIMVLLLVLGSSMPVRSLATRLFVPPASIPTATLVPGIDLFYIVGDLPWGRASLDGHPLAHLPSIFVDPPLKLTRGHHVIEWRAEPLQVQRCTISVPPEFGTDTCRFNDTVQSPSGPDAWLISFPASLAMLSDNQRAALIQAAQAALDAQQSTETVRPGELYNASTREGMFATARQALLATLHFQLDADPASNMGCAINGQNIVQGCFIQQHDCHLFCADPGAPSFFSSGLLWNVFAVALPTWDYTTLDGHSVARNQPDAFGGAIGYEFLVPLQIMWDGSTWHVIAHLDAASTQEFGNPICGSAEVEVQIDFTLIGAVLDNTGVNWNYASSPAYAAGCVAIAVPSSNSFNTPVLSPSSPRVAAYCLQRFGLLLAANDIAHRLWPQMPMADAYEQSLAVQIATAAGIG